MFSIQRVLSITLLWIPFVRAQDSSVTAGDVNLFNYPYGPHTGTPIEYNSTFRGFGSSHRRPSIGAAHGLSDPKDVIWQHRFSRIKLVFAPNLTNTARPDLPEVRKWLPPLDSYEYEDRLENITRRRGGRGLSSDERANSTGAPQNHGGDYTNIYNRNGSFHFTRLWDNDRFWAPACGRMTYEFQRLASEMNLAAVNTSAGASPDHSDAGLTPEVMVKHYGASLPDMKNHNSTIWSYIHAVIPVRGEQHVDVFKRNCVDWLGSIADAAMVLKPSPGAGPRQWIQKNGQPLKYENGTVVMLPPLLIKATSGGVRAVMGEDGSVFILWIAPSWST